MKESNLILPFVLMEKEYKEIKGTNKFQILAMVKVGKNIDYEIFYNSMNTTNKRSIPDEHCERKCYEKYKDRENLSIFVTIAPCDHCYNKFIKDAKNIKNIYYLSKEYQENKVSIEDDRVKCIFDLIKDKDLVNQLIKTEKILLNDYNKHTKKNRIKKEKLNALKKGGD